MNRFAYLIYAAVVVMFSIGINSSVQHLSGGSYRAWGNSSGVSTGSGGGWSGGGHK